MKLKDSKWYNQFKGIWVRVQKEGKQGMGDSNNQTHWQLKYEDGKFEVVDENGIRIAGQTGIEVNQDLDMWRCGYAVVKVSMFMNAYKPTGHDKDKLTSEGTQNKR